MRTARYSTWRADRFTFALRGRGAQRLFSRAAARGIPLYGVRCTAGGYTAGAQGRDLARLQALAAEGGWQFTVVRRRGAGQWAEALLRRPGLPLGFALFCLLLHGLAGFVWSMDLSSLDAGQEQALRKLLGDNGIQEGCYLTQEHLLQVQQTLSLHSEDYAWLSLNFTGGCLYVETSAREQQNVRPPAAGTALYAKAGGEVLAVEVESGFAAVVPGQYVAPGQLLAAAVRADHSGGPVTQAASGRILARVTAEYTAAQALQEQKALLTGRSARQSTLCLLGRQWTAQAPAEQYPNAQEYSVWQPLRLGRISLPGSLHTVERRERQTQTLTYSAGTAAAMARRACYTQLKAQFPDAVVETQSVQTKAEAGQAICTARYVFRADIAEAQPDRGEMAP